MTLFGFYKAATKTLGTSFWLFGSRVEKRSITFISDISNVHDTDEWVVI